MNTIKVTRTRAYNRPGCTGYEWKWTYHLPERFIESPDGRFIRVEPGGFSTKAETIDLARRIYTERPLRLEFPDGTTKELKR
jgi:hypothetical protein